MYATILDSDGSNTTQIVKLIMTETRSFLCINELMDKDRETRVSKDFVINIQTDMFKTETALIMQKEDGLTLSISIRKCVKGENFQVGTKQCITCPPFFYSFRDKFTEPSECNSCSQTDFHCYGGFNITAKPGYWRLNHKSTRFLKCPNSYACRGDPTGPGNSLNGVFMNEFDETLAAGRCAIGYQGILCTQCEDKYGQGDSYKCSLCDDPMFYVILFFKVLFKCFVFIYSFFQALILCKKLGSKGKLIRLYLEFQKIITFITVFIDLKHSKKYLNFFIRVWSCFSLVFRSHKKIKLVYEFK